MFNGMMPFIDVDGGGSGLGYIKNLDWGPGEHPGRHAGDPGHGPVTDMKGLRHFRDFLKDVDVAVEKAVKKGMSRIEAARTIRLEAYPDMKQDFRSLANESSSSTTRSTSASRRPPPGSTRPRPRAPRPLRPGAAW